MGYGFLDNIIEELENLGEDLIMGAEALLNVICPYCHRKTVHRLFKENGDGSYDEVGLKCRKCNRII